MASRLVFENAFQTVVRSVENFLWLERNDALAGRKHIDFLWTSRHGENRLEVRNCLFDEPMNRRAGKGGDWWSSEDNDHSEKLWQAAVDFSPEMKEEIITYVCSKMHAANEKKRKAAAEEKKSKAAAEEKKRKAAAEEKKANDAKKKRKAAADDEQPCAKKAASQDSPETKGYDSDDLEPLPDWTAGRSRTVW
jgi:hypothetical protein